MCRSTERSFQAQDLPCSAFEVNICTIFIIATAEILNRIKFPDDYGGTVCRPPTQGLASLESVIRCMQEAWDESPETRPDFRTIRCKLKEMQAGL